jgi:hypothetical protein
MLAQPKIPYLRPFIQVFIANAVTHILIAIPRSPLEGEIDFCISYTSSKPWQDIICDVEQENNPIRIRALAHELNEAMLEEQRKMVQEKLHLQLIPR